MTDLNKLHDFNRDQLQHMLFVQENVLTLCHRLLHMAMRHDHSKFSSEEYEAFVAGRTALRSSLNGKDPEYQKVLQGEAVKHHLLSNDHHPEYWDAKGLKMPLDCAIVMYMDWKARSMAKNSSMAEFWDFNMKKLEKQPEARVVCEMLRELCGD